MDNLEQLVKENIQMSEALIKLGHYCTCERPTEILPDGGVRAPGPHTKDCVSQIAIQALKPVD
jgi:hypothetical protein